MTATARSRGHEKVGCSSTLSSTPRRPEVPAPAYSSRPPARMRGSAASTAAASWGRAAFTAATAAVWSSMNASNRAGVA